MKKENLIKEYLLNNEDVLIDMVHELNSWNGCLDWLDFCVNDEDFFECYFENKIEVARAICYGDYNYTDDYVRFNGYGNLESFNEYNMIEELKDSIDEIVENLIEYKDCICINDGNLEELLDEEEEEEEEE